MRAPFTDKANSAYHFLFGFAGFYYPIITYGFVGYQVLTWDNNILIDLSEFGAGYFGASLLN